MKTQYKKGLSVLFMLYLVIFTAFASASPDSGGMQKMLNPGDVPKGLSSSQWKSIQSQITANKYKTYASKQGGVNSSNPAHGWHIHYGADGTTTLSPIETDATPYHLAMRLTRIGYPAPGQALAALETPQKISHQDKILDYHWTANLTERWINSETDLEQWFLLKQRPQGAKNGVALTVQMTLDSDLTVKQNSNSLHFSHPSGAKISYNKLKVWDATGRQLTAHMKVQDQQLSLLVDDSAAQYPLTIDPSLQQEAYIKASNTDADDLFGITVAISGDTMVVGAAGETSNATGINGDQTDNSTFDAGAAYVFIRENGTWSQQAYLKASNTDELNLFGRPVSISGNTVVVGASGEASNATGINGDEMDNSANFAGAAYVFTRKNGVWSQQAYLKASNTDEEDFFGNTVAISGNTLVVGAFGEESNATGIDGDQTDNSADSAGAAYVFIREDGTWSQQAYLKASNTDSFDGFGWSVAISSNTVVVGAIAEASNATGIDSDQTDNSVRSAGAAYVFTRENDTWSQQSYLKASNTGEEDSFGQSVAISGNTMVVGALLEGSNATGIDADQTDNSARRSGAAYVFTRKNSIWSQQAYLKASNTDEVDFFSESVAISGNTVVIGAGSEASNATGINGDETDNSALGAGAAYVFTRENDTWSQYAYLKASNTDNSKLFGVSVAISGNTVVAGALGEESNSTGIDGDQTDNSAAGAGAVYVYTIEPPMSNSERIFALKIASLNQVSDRPVRLTANARLAQVAQYYNIAAANYRQSKFSIGNRFLKLAIASLNKFKATLERGIRLNKFPAAEVQSLLDEADSIIA